MTLREYKRQMATLRKLWDDGLIGDVVQVVTENSDDASTLFAGLCQHFAVRSDMDSIRRLVNLSSVVLRARNVDNIDLTPAPETKP